MQMICVAREGNYFSRGDWTGCQLICPCQAISTAVREDVASGCSPPPDMLFASLTTCHPPHKGEGQKERSFRESFSSRTKIEFYPSPLWGGSARSVGVGVAHGSARKMLLTDAAHPTGRRPAT